VFDSQTRNANAFACANLLALDMKNATRKKTRPSASLDADLGRRERQLMEALYGGEALSVSEVQQRLSNPPSYSSVRTMLGILERKGYVTHEERGRAFYYRAKRPQEEIKHSALSHILNIFFGGSATDLVATLVDSKRRLDGLELEELAGLIEKARREGR
jgi:predicted transcriptional regulator